VALAEGDENPANDTTRTAVRAGGGQVVVSEIMFAPASGASEWVELLNASESPVDLKGWTMEDSSRKKSVVTALSLSLPAARTWCLPGQKGKVEPEERMQRCRRAGWRMVLPQQLQPGRGGLRGRGLLTRLLGLHQRLRWLTATNGQPRRKLAREKSPSRPEQSGSELGVFAAPPLHAVRQEQRERIAERARERGSP
jgi:hypothetical protein